MSRTPWSHGLALVLALIAVPTFAQPPTTPTPAPSTQRERKPQTRPSGSRVEVDPSKVRVDDGDTAVIQWSAADAETVRFLGIDTPETRHPAHELPYAQPFGPEARAFAMGAFATASKIELLRAAMIDPYGRTLGYFFLNGKSYAVMVVSARLAEESVTRYGDNGLPQEAAAVKAAAQAAGPLPFESPNDFRRRMRDVSRWMRAKNVDPER
jgi:endonuclease YncB( thermonuclease family)